MLKTKRIVQSGFSLLELLLVIVIIAVIATFGISTLRQYTNNMRITETAEQMLGLQQAAAAYFIDTGNWPTSCNDPNFANYYVIKSLTNPFGSNYTCQVSTGGKKFAVYSGPITETGAIQQLMAKLPSATVSGNQVYSEIVIPIKPPINVHPNYIIVYIGTPSGLTDQAPRSFSFTCPNGWKGGAFAAMRGFYAADWFANGPVGNICWNVGPGSTPISTLGSYSTTGSLKFGPGCKVVSQNQDGSSNYYCSYNTVFLSYLLPNTISCGSQIYPWGYPVSSVNPLNPADMSQAYFLEVGYCQAPAQTKSPYQTLLKLSS